MNKLFCCPDLLMDGCATFADNPEAQSASQIDRYNVIWDSPSKDAAGSMPLGNGELGINLWVEENSDLLFYLGRNDSFSEISQLCKVGKIRVSLTPNPFKSGIPFKQELKLINGVCDISAGDVKLKVFVDSANPVVHVVGQSASPLTVTARIESWREQKQKVCKPSYWTLHDAPFEVWQEADHFPFGLPDAIAWYHRNETSTAFEATVKTQSLTQPMSVGKAHTLQRHMPACAGRGIYPIKFNGSIFTVEPTHMGEGDNPDWRKWGDCHWWQYAWNQGLEVVALQKGYHPAGLGETEPGNACHSPDRSGG